MKSKMLLCPVCQKSHYHELSVRGMCSSCAHIHRERIRRLCPVCQKRVFNPAPGREACSSCAASQPLNPNASEQVTRQRSDQVTRILQFEAVLLDPHGTLQEVATQLGISRERVRQIISTYPELAHLRSVCRINARKILRKLDCLGRQAPLDIRFTVENDPPRPKRIRGGRPKNISQSRKAQTSVVKKSTVSASRKKRVK